jgi:aminobenzoyl-glutamate utilization protein B
MIDPAFLAAGRTIAASLIELLMDPPALKKAQDEFKERTGGGIGGSKWVAPLLPPDFEPPVDLRWPEYITTERGREWWIPTPKRERT